MNIILLIGRILLGGYFFIEGANHFLKLNDLTNYTKSKGIPLPQASVIVSGLLLLVGGLGILLGVYVHMAIITLVIFLIPVTFTMHAFWKDSDKMTRMSGKINFMKNMALLGSLLMLYALYSFDWSFVIGN